MQLVCLILIHWIEIYPMDTIVQLLNNWHQSVFRFSFQLDWQIDN